MATFTSLIPLLVVTGAYASPTYFTQPKPSTSGIQWAPCETLNTELPVECAKLEVPLDYTQEGGKSLSLDLIKYPAQNGPSKGSILLNFGGPGQDGVKNMLSYGPVQGPITGGQHDLISWDPRGTGNTLRFACWPNGTEPTVDALGSTWLTSSDTAPGRLWADGTIVAEACAVQLNETAELVGMTFTAKDMMQIVDALGEDGMLRYWGISAGTILGATAAAMFPDRMDKVILDGVSNSHEYYHGFETEALASADDAFTGFLSACLGSPDACPLSKRGETVEDLEKIMSDFFQHIKYNPIPYMGTPFDYSAVKGIIISTLYKPAQFPQLAGFIDGLLDRNLTKAFEALGGSETPTEKQEPSEAANGAQDQAIIGIRCGDKSPRTTSLAELDPVFEKALNTSKWFGDFGAGPYIITCAQWPFQAKERYEGDFHVKTKNPILFVGNSYDPVTPLVSARNMSAGFEGSVLLHHNGYGHVSFSQPSNCTIDAIQKYFLNGVLPAPDTVCEPNAPLFGDISIPGQS